MDIISENGLRMPGDYVGNGGNFSAFTVYLSGRRFAGPPSLPQAIKKGF